MNEKAEAESTSTSNNETNPSGILTANNNNKNSSKSSSSKSRKKNRSLLQSEKKNNRTSTTAHHSSTNHSNKENDLSKMAASSSSQPYYLNHVRGSTRVRHASQRLAAAFGTLFSSYLLCSYNSSSLTSLSDIGLHISSFQQVLIDFGCGFGVGSCIVLLMLVCEWRMGWIRIVGFGWETVVEEEVFWINFGWDVLFHLGVSFNEEVMLRGWMFTLGCHGLLAFEQFQTYHPTTAANIAIASSILLQSTLFAFLHVSSPGSSAICLLNLFLGGIAASLNVMVAPGGSLWLGMGWHFGWNIGMGHVLGRSTSGIPMSCKVVGVIPRPIAVSSSSSLPSSSEVEEKKRISYEKYHGGTFGPEQGVLAPLAYVLGMAMVIWLYGWEHFGEWRERLVMMNVSESN
mmetsp:Transcript_24306/g.43821  ORF Transcript_24306/g.43821 Transcript_24306/m.43821 type:complete len:401 (+) Transcript_24306:205-1407(+)